MELKYSSIILLMNRNMQLRFLLLLNQVCTVDSIFLLKCEGNYTFVVKAREMFGTESVSNPVMVTVNPAPISATTTTASTTSDESMSQAATYLPQFLLLAILLFVII